MNISFSQLLVIIIIYFLLFGDLSNVSYNTNILLQKIKAFFTNLK
nr:Sec-independent protein translocase component tatA/E [Cryptomonas gyropyrenoidosa]WFQ82689.1 Sec-independent protein translocase component tatA/E [Cryptomonas gyropyrenoidosa]